jgi:hypothetical protein
MAKEFAFGSFYLFLLGFTPRIFPRLALLSSLLLLVRFFGFQFNLPTFDYYFLSLWIDFSHFLPLGASSLYQQFIFTLYFWVGRKKGFSF